MPLDFDGVNDLVNCNSAAVINNVVSKTLSCWLKADNYGEGNLGNMFAKLNWNFRVDSSGALNYRNVFSVGTLGVWRSAVNSFNTGSWTHVAVTYVRSSTSNIPTFFINGSSQTTTTVIQPVGSANAENTSAYVLGNNAAAAATFDGKLEEMAFYNAVLTAEDILRLATSRIRGTPLMVAASNLIAYHPLDEFPDGATASGTSSNRDRSANINHGTPTNSPVGRASQVLSYA